MKWCLDSIDTTKEELAGNLHIVLPTLELALAGEAALTINQLKNLAEYFHKSMLFFINPADVEEEKIMSVQFRTINNRRPVHSRKLRTIIERVEEHREIYLELLDELEITHNSNWYPKQINFQNSNKKAIAQEIREWLEIPEIRDFMQLRKLVEEKDIMVFVSSGYKGDWQIDKEEPVRGFSLYYDILPLIMIKKQSEGGQAFTLIHELIHLLLHKNSVLDYDEDYECETGLEKEANLIAGYILIPDELLERITPDDLDELEVTELDHSLQPFADQWCVSVEAILVRLNQEKLIDYTLYSKYRKYKIDLQQTKLRNKEEEERIIIPRYYRNREPLKIFGQSYVRAVLEAYQDQHITLAKASTFLDNIKIKDVHELERYVIQL